MDGQMQGHGTVAVMDRSEMLYIVAALGVNLFVPCIAVASRFGKLEGGGIMDGQV